ncbi:hypothetical protein [Reichenbachiella sp. MSK19-1]|uniref:hypothetical protein n=1 Tax=Reichenbachiella sp. MSK19-1 TaxID=1897631 RepID=UPI0011C3E3CA|nr:hypothetical protein [Reichenbachiella sp. MSK19-1]
MIPDNFIYHYQSLIGGVLALVAGLLAYYAAMRAERRKDKEYSEKKQNFAISVFIKLKVVQEELEDIVDVLGHDLDELKQKVRVPEERDLSFSEIPQALWEAWTLGFGLSPEIMLKIENLFEDLEHCKKSSQELNSILLNYKKRSVGLGQMTISMFEDDRLNEFERIHELLLRNKKWFESSTITVEKLTDDIVKSFKINRNIIDRLWERPD